MDAAISALIIIAIVLFGALTLTHSSLSIQDSTMVSLRAAQDRALERSRTNISLTSARTLPGGNAVEITVRNTGAVKLVDFQLWDVIVQYDSPGTRNVRWYPYVETIPLASNQWTVLGIYTDAAKAIPEAYDPGILDPGEEMVVRIAFAPPALEGSTKVATIATPTGIDALIAFSN